MMSRKTMLMGALAATVLLALFMPGCGSTGLDSAISDAKENAAITERARVNAEAKAEQLAQAQAAVQAELEQARAEARETAAIEIMLKDAETKVATQNAVISELKDQEAKYQTAIAVLETVKERSAGNEVPVGEFIRGTGEAVMPFNPVIGGLLLLAGSIAKNIQQAIIMRQKQQDLEASHEAIASISVLEAGGLLDLSKAKPALKGCQSDAAQIQVQLAKEKAIGLDALAALAKNPAPPAAAPAAPAAT